LDFWALPTPAADAKDSGFTIKLPQPGRLVVHYDVAGGDAQAKLLLQLYAWAGPNSRGVFNMREPMVANRGQIVLDNLPPGYYDLSRQKPDASAGARGGFRCDLRTVIIESGKTATSDFVRQHGTRVHGRIVGLKEGMFADNMKPGALVTVGPAWASAYSWHLCKWQIGILDGLRCGPDGKFQTEPLEPGKYSVIAEAYLAPKPEDRTDQSRRLPAFVGRAEVTVPEEGAAPQVTVELRLRAKSDGGESEKRPAGVPAGHGDAATPAKVPPGELAAAVADAAGKPLAGVLAEVWTWCPGDKTTTDEEGRFVLKNLGSEPVELRVSKKGFGPWYNPVQPTGVELHVTLSDKTYFEGDVKGPDGKPVGDALIRADSGPKRNPQVEITSVWTETRTDQNGHYRLCVMPDKYVIHVRVPKVGVARLPQTLIGEGEAKRLDINLTPGVKFRAIAVDSQSGDPIANVRLSNWRHKGIEGTSGQDGKIAIDGMTPGHFAFDVTCKGYTRWWSPQAVQQDQKKDLSRDLQRNFDYLEFDVTDDMPPVRIELEREVRISGVVQDPDGNPVAGATAAPAHTGTGNSLTGDTRFSVVTGKDGTFVMSLPASGNAKYNLEAHDGGYQQWRKWANGVLDPIQTKPGDELKNVVIKLTRPATVRGHVKDESGKPLADREVRASAADKLENRYYDPTTTTDKEGNFALRFIRPGDHFIQAAPFWATDVPAGQNLLRVPVKNSLRVTLKEGETKAGVELEAPASTRFPSVEEQIHRAIEEQIRRESEKAAYPAAQPGHQGAAAAQTLSFGPVKDGMQAAAEVSADEPFQVRFHIRNASAQTVTIAGNGLRQDAECIIEDQQGRRVAVKKTIPWFTYEMKRDKVEPGGETIFPNGGLSFLPQRNCWDYPSYTAQAKPGRYTVRFRLHFPWEPVSEKPGPQDWKGDLETAPVTIEVKEPSVAAQKLLANKLAEIQKLEAELASLPSKKGLTEAQRSTATSNLETHLGALKENAESVRALIQKIRTEKGTSPLSHSPEATSPEAPAKPPAAKPDPPASQPAKHSTVGTGQWHRLATGELASVDVERTLYEKEGQRHFFIRVRITNLANRPVGIDLNNYWKVTYPNQWGMENADHRTDIDERRMVPKDLDAAAREELLAAFRTGGLTTIPPGKSIDYYREFNASGRADVDAQEKQGKYLIVSLDGVLRLTDGEGVEQVSCAWGRKTQAPTDLVIPTPVPWRAIPSAGRIVAERADTLPALIQYHSERLGLTLKVPKGWIEMEGAGDRSRVLALAEPEPWRDRVQTKLELRVEDAAGNVALSLTDKADSSATVSKRISVDGVPARVTGYRLPPDNKAEILTLQVAKNSRFYTASLVFGSDRREFYLALADAVFQSLRPDVAGDAKKSPGDPQPDAKPAGAAAVAVKAMASGT
jgi:protocatechuate 3,4-dioxygenase beta subunit